MCSPGPLKEFTLHQSSRRIFETRQAYQNVNNCRAGLTH